MKYARVRWIGVIMFMLLKLPFDFPTIGGPVIMRQRCASERAMIGRRAEERPALCFQRQGQKNML
jgi:hypothetical protein